MAWYIPFLIFGARLLDVPLGTVRMILIVQGHRYIAATLGFFEVAIWALAVGGVIKYLTDPFALTAYAGGFAIGTLVGMNIEDRLAIGYRTVRVFNPNGGLQLCDQLRERGYRVTRVAGEGRDGDVEIAFMVLRRRSVPQLFRTIQELAPRAFTTVERCDKANGGGFAEIGVSRRLWGKMSLVRK